MTGRLLVLVTVCLSLSPASARDDVSLKRNKRFSLFSIVQFPNEVCVTGDINVKEGVCTTSTECTAGGGTASGKCASGFGVCCIYKVTECGTTIAKNISYIQNPGFPSTYTTTGTCSYKISKSDPSVCQIRLDFDNLVLGGNSATGSSAGCCGADCGTTPGTDAADSLTVLGKSGKNPPVICHTNTNSHMYVQTGSGDTDQVSLDFFLSDTSGSTTTLGANLRKWNVRITQIPCGTKYQAPPDCVQYYTGTQGYVQSYGFGSGQLLSSQNYKACIRQEQGYCSIDWHPSSRTNPDSFNMINGDFTAGTPPAADVNNGVNAIGDCLANYINIPDAMTYTSNNKYTELCGEVWATDGTELALGPLRSYTTPFTLEVFSDDSTDKVLASSATTSASGFELVYQQIPCGM